MDEPPIKPVRWLGSSRKDLKEMPEPIQRVFGFALYTAQRGERHLQAKPLSGFHGAGILEIVEDFDGNTYRAVYTVRFEESVYVLHVFQKKSKQGIKTPQQDMERIAARLKQAEELHNRLAAEAKEKDHE